MSYESIGLCLGFFGAACQAANYAFTKDCQERFHLTGIKQLIAVHLFMIAVALVPFLWFEHYRYINAMVCLYNVGIVAPYLVAQYMSIKAIALSEASIVSPLMTIKIPILAIISVTFLGQGFSVLQCVSITAIILMGWYFSSLSGTIKLRPLCYIAIVCTCFCWSDIAMTYQMKYFAAELNMESHFEQIFVGITFEYIFCAVPLLPCLFIHKFKVSPANVMQAKWIGIAWLLSMVGIVGCFNLAGVVEGNIIQTLRSVMGVIIAYLFYRQYIQDHNLFKKKLAIAVGMFIAVTVYYL